MGIPQEQDYELAYWEGRKGKHDDRASVMARIFGELPDSEEAADIGCGPRGGIFCVHSFSSMYAVDPLWTRYHREGLVDLPDGVEEVEGYAETFKLPELVGVMFSVNALDHSGDIYASLENMSCNLKRGGSLFLHVHMRTKEQLNAGHKMLIKEEDIDKALNNIGKLDKRIYEECPLDRKPYRSYVATVVKK